MTTPKKRRGNPDGGIPHLKKILNVLGLIALVQQLLFRSEPSWAVLIAAGALVGYISLDTLEDILRGVLGRGENRTPPPSPPVDPPEKPPALEGGS